MPVDGGMSEAADRAAKILLEIGRKFILNPPPRAEPQPAVPYPHTAIVSPLTVHCLPITKKNAPPLRAGLFGSDVSVAVYQVALQV